MQIPDSQAPVPMSQRAYGERRGVSHVAVQRAIKAGRLKASVRDGKIIDPDLADREWDAHTDLSKAPGYVRERAAKQNAPRLDPFGHLPRLEPAPAAGESPQAVLGGSLAENNAAKAYWQAKQAELDFREAAGDLVPAKDVEREWADVLSQARTKILGVPNRARQALPHLSVADIGVIEGLVRETLEDLVAEQGAA